MTEIEVNSERVEEIHKLVKKNNRMIKRMYDAQRRASFFRFLDWIIIVILAVIAYIYIEPYIGQLEDMYTKVQGTLEEIPGLNIEEEQI